MEKEQVVKADALSVFGPEYEDIMAIKRNSLPTGVKGIVQDIMNILVYQGKKKIWLILLKKIKVDLS